MLWRCWLDITKSIHLVKKWLMRCWRGYLYAARCKWFAYGPADATASPLSLASVKFRLVLPFLYWLTHDDLEKRPMKGVWRWRISDLLAISGCIKFFSVILYRCPRKNVTQKYCKANDTQPRRDSRSKSFGTVITVCTSTVIKSHTIIIASTISYNTYNNQT